MSSVIRSPAEFAWVLARERQWFDHAILGPPELQQSNNLKTISGENNIFLTGEACTCTELRVLKLTEVFKNAHGRPFSSVRDLLRTTSWTWKQTITWSNKHWWFISKLNDDLIISCPKIALHKFHRLIKRNQIRTSGVKLKEMQTLEDMKDQLGSIGGTTKFCRFKQI